MKLTLNNIGRIKRTTIDINGITVIGGENNTGKSTVSKALFAVLNAVYDLKNTVKVTRIQSFEKIIDRILSYKNELTLSDFVARKKLVWKMNDSLPNNLSLKNFKEYLSSDSYLKKIIFLEKLNKEDLEKIYAPFTIANKEIISKIIEKSFDYEFNKQTCNVNKSCAEIVLQIARKNIKIEFKNKGIGETSIKNCFISNTNVHYLDNSIMIDQMDNSYSPRSFYDYQICSHGEKMLRLMSKKTEDDVVNEIIVDKELKEVFGILNEVCPGKIVENDSMEFQYLSDNKIAFSLENVSAGLKTFAIIKTLLTKGFLKRSDVLILDEPEIHLHPKWQVVFAKLIVLLQQKFDLKILINTHSPYFLNALEVFIDKYKVVSKNCKFYLSSLDENGDAIFYDETNSVDKIYDLLAQPFQELENMKYE